MSRPNQVRIMLVLAFLLTLVAGAVVGAGFARSTMVDNVPPPPGPTPTPSTKPNEGGRDWIMDRLKLDPEQRKQWAVIWSASPRDRFKQIGEAERACYKNRNDGIFALYTSEQSSEKDRLYSEYRAKINELNRERDKAISALYTPEQKAERERLEKDCSTKVADLKAERDRLMQPLLDSSRKILTEEQKRHFDAIFRGPGPGVGPGPSHRGGGPGGNNSGGSPNRRSSTQPSTRPVVSPATQPVVELGSQRAGG